MRIFVLIGLNDKIGRYAMQYKSKTKIQKGVNAPSFRLEDQNGEKHSLADYLGQWVLLYFYPKDDTLGCTKEACSMRDDLPGFNKLSVKVLGVSADSTASHKKFAKKYNLPVTLLADVDKKVIKKYGAWRKKKIMGREYMGIWRSSFLIDPEGKVAIVYDKVNPETHAREVLDDLRALAN